jgi:hypothetical protein
MRASYSQTGSENILSVARSRERTRVYNEARERADSLIQAAGLEGLDATVIGGCKLLAAAKPN